LICATYYLKKVKVLKQQKQTVSMEVTKKNKDALEKAKRTFSQYYISLMKLKHPIIFSFFPTKDYNTMKIKIDIL